MYEVEMNEIFIRFECIVNENLHITIFTVSSCVYAQFWTIIEYNERCIRGGHIHRVACRSGCTRVRPDRQATRCYTASTYTSRVLFYIYHSMCISTLFPHFAACQCHKIEIWNMQATYKCPPASVARAYCPKTRCHGIRLCRNSRARCIAVSHMWFQFTNTQRSDITLSAAVIWVGSSLNDKACILLFW